MKKSLSVLATFVAFSFFVSAVAAPMASASEISTQNISPQHGEPIAVSTQPAQLPGFIPDGAVPMTDAEMSEVRGEVVVMVAIGVAVGGTLIMKAIYGESLCNSGWCFVTPWFAKPLIAN